MVGFNENGLVLNSNLDTNSNDGFMTIFFFVELKTQDTFLMFLIYFFDNSSTMHFPIISRPIVVFGKTLQPATNAQLHNNVSLWNVKSFKLQNESTKHLLNLKHEMERFHCDMFNEHMSSLLCLITSNEINLTNSRTLQGKFGPYDSSQGVFR